MQEGWRRSKSPRNILNVIFRRRLRPEPRTAGPGGGTIIHRVTQAGSVEDVLEFQEAIRAGETGLRYF